MPVTGYTNNFILSAGGTLNCFLSVPSPTSAAFSVQQLGVSGAVSATFNIGTVPSQTIPSSGWNGFNWQQTYSFHIPSNWPTGLYSLTAKSSTDSSYSEVFRFVILPKTPGTSSKILVLVDFITPQAYNNAGGKSLYDYNSGNFSGARASTVSFYRTYNDGMGPEDSIIQWLTTNGHSTEVASTLDLHTNSNLLAPYYCVVFGDHNEYWSKEMRDQVENFVWCGGNVVCLSGNTCYRQVRIDPVGMTITCYKDQVADPETNCELVSVAWAQSPVNRPPNTMLGAGWTHGAFFVQGNTPGSYNIAFPSHWAMSGVSGGITSAFMNYETDAAPFVWEQENYPRVTREEQTPLSTTVLAYADLTGWTGKPGFATASLLVHNGMVFHSGTTEWIASMSSDPAIKQITQNIVTRLSVPRAFDWELVGGATGVTASACANDRIFASDNQNVLWMRHPVLADAAWRNVGSALNVTSMAGTKGLLFAVTSDNNLWSRPPVESNIDWTSIGTGPTNGTLAIAAVGAALYAIDKNGNLFSRPANSSNIAWTAVVPPIGNPLQNNSIVAMTSCAGFLIAATSGNRLIRTNRDFVEEGNGWVDVIHCDFATSLSALDNMLFVTTNTNQMWWLDLHSMGWSKDNTSV